MIKTPDQPVGPSSKTHNQRDIVGSGGDVVPVSCDVDAHDSAGPALLRGSCGQQSQRRGLPARLNQLSEQGVDVFAERSCRAG